MTIKKGKNLVHFFCTYSYLNFKNCNGFALKPPSLLSLKSNVHGGDMIHWTRFKCRKYVSSKKILNGKISILAICGFQPLPLDRVEEVAQHYSGRHMCSKSYRQCVKLILMLKYCNVDKRSHTCFKTYLDVKSAICILGKADKK